MNNSNRQESKWSPESPRPRAVFSQEDFDLLHKALSVYVHNHGNSLDEDESRKYSNLMHRLTRITK